METTFERFARQLDRPDSRAMLETRLIGILDRFRDPKDRDSARRLVESLEKKATLRVAIHALGDLLETGWDLGYEAGFDNDADSLQAFKAATLANPVPLTGSQMSSPHARVESLLDLEKECKISISAKFENHLNGMDPTSPGYQRISETFNSLSEHIPSMSLALFLGLFQAKWMAGYLDGQDDLNA